MTEEKKTCLKCKNQDCFMVYGVPQEKKKDCKEHHENYDWNRVFDCKNHNKFKEYQNAQIYKSTERKIYKTV